MNSLDRPDAGIIGSNDAIEILQKAETSRLLVVSDTHGHYAVFEAIIREYGNDCDALLFAGDGIWDIVQYLENCQTSEKLRQALPPVVAFVAGNGDGDQYRVSLPVLDDAREPERLGYTIMVPPRRILLASCYRIFMVHGHHHSVDVSPEILVNVAHSMNCDIVVFGHTHVPMSEEFSHIFVLNPGSPARPRGYSAPGFAILELDSTCIVPKVSFISVRENLYGTYRFSEKES